MQLKSELPEGWVETSLEEILFLFESGSRPKGGVRGISKGIPSIGGEHLNGNGGFRFNKVKFVSDEFFENMNQGIIKVNDILIVKDGATTGKVSIVTKDFPYDKAAVNEHVFLCRLHSEISQNNIFYFLFSEVGQQRILDNFRGSAQGGINKSFAPNTLIPLPPLAEQHRIASAIESLFARLDVANERLDRMPAIFKKFRQSVLAAACDGRLTKEWRTINEDKLNVFDSLNNLDIKNIELDISNDYDSAIQLNIPQEWKWSLCNDLCDKNRALTYGVIKLGSETEDGIPTLRSSDVRWLKIDTNHIKRISPEIASNYSRTFLKGGEILVTVRGTLGGVAVVPQNKKGFNISREVAVIPLLSELNVHFFCYAISSKWCQNWLSGMAKGVAYTGINIKDLKNLPLPFPPLSEQHEIVRRVDALFALADSIEAKVAAARERTEKMRQSIFKKAFSGELVSTEAELARREGRDYEPADVLLERIKVERGKSGKKGKAAK